MLVTLEFYWHLCTPNQMDINWQILMKWACIDFTRIIELLWWLCISVSSNPSHATFMRSHFLLSLAIGAPRILVEAIIEVIGDVGTGFSPRFLFYRLDIEFDGRLSADGANTFEFFHTEFSHGRFGFFACSGSWCQQCSTLFYVVAWARFDVANCNDHIVIVTVVVVIALAILFAILYFAIYVFIVCRFISRAIDMIAIFITFSLGLFSFILKNEDNERKM